jgi:LL-diaminopimelate aminotransferase
VVVTPGSGFGTFGEGYFRIAFTLSDERLAEAMHRLEQFHSEI